MRRSLILAVEFERKTSYRHSSYAGRLDRYRSLLAEMVLTEADIEQRVNTAMESQGPLEPIAPEVERLLGPAKPVQEVLDELDRQM